MEGSVTVRPGSSIGTPRREEPPGDFRAWACRSPKLEDEPVSRRNQKEEPPTRARMKGGLPLSVSMGIVVAGAGAEATKRRAPMKRMPGPLAGSRFFVASLLRMTGTCPPSE
jgi:hypothetical protein